MKVFISWSGELSKQIAEIIREYLPVMIQGLDVFMSKHDIESGSRWSLELAKELEESSFGILCLTSDNLESAWLLFEAGALTKHIEARACGILIGGLKSTDVREPLSQFQNRPFLEDEFKALLIDINKKLSKPLEDKNLDFIFKKWWPDIKQKYDSAIESSKKKISIPHRDQKDILEEILKRIRSIGSIVEKGSSIEITDLNSIVTKAAAQSRKVKLYHKIVDYAKQNNINVQATWGDPSNLMIIYTDKTLPQNIQSLFKEMADFYEIELKISDKLIEISTNPKY